MKVLTLSFCLLMSWSCSALAIDIFIGAGLSSHSIIVEDEALDEREVADVKERMNLRPIAGLRSKSMYLGDNSGWGYQYELGGALIDVKTQKINGVADPVEMGTRMEGYSVYAVPHFFYHINKFSQNGFKSKLGLGMGAGYVSLKGDFMITDKAHAKYGEIQTVDAAEVGLAWGFYIEVSKGNHIFAVQNNAPSISDESYNYMQHNTLISYKYIVFGF